MTETRFLRTSDGTAIAWDGAGSGPDVMLVHGLGSSRRRWDDLRGELVTAGFRVLRFDLRGFGESSGAEKEHGFAELYSDLLELSAAEARSRFHLIGHSLGGMIAQRFAVEHPDRLRSLVLASTTSHNGQRASAFARAMVLFSKHGFDRVRDDPELRPEIDRILRDAFPGVDPPLEMLRIGVEKPHPARANAWRACIDFSVKDRLHELSCPVLVLHGSADPLIPFRAGELVHRAIPHSEWREEAGAGHSLPTERKAELARAVIDFLGRAERA